MNETIQPQHIDIADDLKFCGDFGAFVILIVGILLLAVWNGAKQEQSKGRRRR